MRMNTDDSQTVQSGSTSGKKTGAGVSNRGRDSSDVAGRLTNNVHPYHAEKDANETYQHYRLSSNLVGQDTKGNGTDDSRYAVERRLPPAQHGQLALDLGRLTPRIPGERQRVADD